MALLQLIFLMQLSLEVHQQLSSKLSLSPQSAHLSDSSLGQ